MCPWPCPCPCPCLSIYVQCMYVLVFHFCVSNKCDLMANFRTKAWNNNHINTFDVCVSIKVLCASEHMHTAHILEHSRCYLNAIENGHTNIYITHTHTQILDCINWLHHMHLLYILQKVYIFFVVKLNVWRVFEFIVSFHLNCCHRHSLSLPCDAVRFASVVAAAVVTVQALSS